DIEIRMPFCDYNIVEYAYNIPWKYKAYKGQEKAILREAFKDTLPPQIVGRKKSPFPKTYSPLFYNNIKEKLKNILNQKGSLLESLIDKEYLNNLIESPNAKIPNWYGQLMRLPQIMGYIIQIDSFFKHFNIDIE
ncbi:MAG: asparagine synthase-related protein, partial [Clostridia bacterium]|nr:asparagine synthase-related protein [Clostridia bacterium]